MIRPLFIIKILLAMIFFNSKINFDVIFNAGSLNDKCLKSKKKKYNFTGVRRSSKYVC